MRSAYIAQSTHCQPFAKDTMPRDTTRRYHHGNLRQAVIDTALQLADESGDERISLREVARRIGVSSGAPFRHFTDHAALMTAIAEEATVRLRLMVDRDQHRSPPAAIERLRTLGHSFLAWALQHPTSFRLVSARRLYDFNASPALKSHFQAVRERTVTLVMQAQSEGDLQHDVAPERLALMLRSAVYGMARMHVDGQLAQWGVGPRAARRELQATLDALIDGFRRNRPR
jgi:AcrR family transcriptional regulator